MFFNSEATEDIVAEDTKVVEKEAADSAADVEVPELGYGRIALGLVGGLPAVLANVAEVSDMEIKETVEEHLKDVKNSEDEDSLVVPPFGLADKMSVCSTNISGYSDTSFPHLQEFSLEDPAKSPCGSIVEHLVNIASERFAIIESFTSCVLFEKFEINFLMKTLYPWPPDLQFFSDLFVLI